MWKMLTLWENLQLLGLGCDLWQRVWRASTWFSLNHLPAGHHALTKACYGCHKLTLYHNPAITSQQLHPSGEASACSWLRRNWIKILWKGLKLHSWMSATGCFVYCRACDHLCCWSGSHHMIQLGIPVYVFWWFDLHRTCHALCYMWFRSQVEAANHCAKIMWLNVSGPAASLKGNKWTPIYKVQGPGINICYSQK